MKNNNITNLTTELIKEKMKIKNINNHQLSVLSGLDKSTVSKILNNKQKANINHLKKISIALDIPLQELMKLEGYITEEKEEIKAHKFDLKFEDLDDIMKFTSIIDCEQLEKNIESELKKYEQYLQTHEGKELIDDSFLKKIESINYSGAFIDKLKELYEIYKKNESGFQTWILIGSALLYFIISTDLIPDFLFPIGFLDDMIAIKLVIDKLNKINSKI